MVCIHVSTPVLSLQVQNCKTRLWARFLLFVMYRFLFSAPSQPIKPDEQHKHGECSDKSIITVDQNSNVNIFHSLMQPKKFHLNYKLNNTQGSHSRKRPMSESDWGISIPTTCPPGGVPQISVSRLRLHIQINCLNLSTFLIHPISISQRHHVTLGTTLPQEAGAGWIIKSWNVAEHECSKHHKMISFAHV